MATPPAQSKAIPVRVSVLGVGSLGKEHARIYSELAKRSAGQYQFVGIHDVDNIKLRAMAPVLYDAYRRNRATGSFVLVDEATNATVAAGMLLDEQS